MLVVREVKDRTGLSHPTDPSWLYSPCYTVLKRQGKKPATGTHEKCWIVDSSNLVFGIKAVRGTYPDPALHRECPL